MRVILVDDEPLALDVIKYALEKYDDAQIVGAYTDPKLALKSMETTKPDVIFLDIEMGPVNGLDIAEDFIAKNNSVEIVFITAYSDYAIEAFELNVIDYILKPIQEKRLKKTIIRLKNKIKSKEEVDETDNILKVECFGKLEATNTSGQTLSWRTQKSKELFAYLLVQENKQALKDVIMEVIFPGKELEKANALLYTTIYQLRRNLNKLGFNKSIIYKNGWYSLSLPIKTDFDKLNKIIYLKEISESHVSEIISIYKGDFLEYEGYHWAFGIRQKYKIEVIKLLNDYIKVQMEKNHFPLILFEALEMMSKIDPFDEDIVRNVIEYYGRQGRIKELDIFYKRYKDKLSKELELEPLDDIVKLLNKYYR